MRRAADPQLHFRSATPDDVNRMAALSVRCYPRRGDSIAARAQAYAQSAWFSIPDYTLVERDDRHVGQYLTLAFTGWFGGVGAPVGGLAGVAVAPEDRRSGVAASIVAHHLGVLVQAGCAWAMLYPFAADFYGDFGWAPAASRVRWHLRPRELPLYPERARVRSLYLGDAADSSAVQAAYERQCRRVSGSLSRTPRQLLSQYKPDSVYVAGVPGEAGLTGYLIYTLRNPTPHPITMTVLEHCAEDAASERALIGFVAAQSAQVERLEIDTPPEHPIVHLMQRGLPEIEDSDAMPHEHQPLGRLFSGAMARVVSLQRALEGRGYPGDGGRPPTGRLAVAASDELVPSNATPVTLTVEAGRPQALPGRAAGTPLLAGPVAEITRVLVGALRLRTALGLGLVSLDPAPDEATVHALDSLLALPAPYPLVTF